MRCYHGLGDTLQFIRYVPRLRAIAAEVTVWAQPELLSLLGTAAGIDRLLPLHDGAPDAVYDTDVELMELPHVFRSTPELQIASWKRLTARGSRPTPLRNRPTPPRVASAMSTPDGFS